MHQPFRKSHQQSGDWPESIHRYDPTVRKAYYAGTQFKIWRVRHKEELLFCDRMERSRQIPHSGPLTTTHFFNELYIGCQYLDAGFGVLFFYRRVEDEQCYLKACELLGGNLAMQFISPNSEKGGRAPDLLVFNKQNNRFRFVECKGKGEPFAPSQPQRFRGIEKYLNDSAVAGNVLSESQREDLFPPLAPGQWLHIARLLPGA